MYALTSMEAGSALQKRREKDLSNAEKAKRILNLIRICLATGTGTVALNLDRPRFLQCDGVRSLSHAEG